MADLSLIQGAVLSLKAATDIAKGFLDLRTIAEVQTKVIDLQTTILAAQGSALAAQSDQAAMVDEIRTLKEEIARVKAWEAQKQRYALTKPMDFGGGVVYGLKESMSAGEPPHWICTQCYEDGRRSILNPHYPKGQAGMLFCGSCKSALHYHYVGSLPEPTYAAE